MAFIEVVIKIPDEAYKACLKLKGELVEDNSILGICLINSVANGTLLQKGHGKLIDADAFERRCMFDSNIEDMQDVIYGLRDYKPIIEADKGD